MPKVAFCTPPHYGGIYSVFRRLREAVAPAGWDVLSVYTSEDPARWYGYDASLGGDETVCVPVDKDSIQRQAQQLTDWFVRNDIAVVVPMSLPTAMAAVPHLPREIAIVTRCVDITPHAYRLATWGLPQIDRVVATSPRQCRDLQRRYGVSQDALCHIPNAVDVARFMRAHATRGAGESLRLIFIDRLDHTQKRIFLLPDILVGLERDGVPFDLTVVGDGPDARVLRQRLKPWIHRGMARMVGAVPGDDILGHLAGADVMLKMSRSEGFPSSVIEAMATGVVPVVSRLRGVTDWIVEHERTGLLCPLDDTRAFVRACTLLHREHERREDMAARAATDIADRFGLEAFGERWANVFSEACAVQERVAPQPWSQFRTPLPIRGTWAHRLLWQHVPRPWKDKARAMRENLVRSGT